MWRSETIYRSVLRVQDSVLCFYRAFGTRSAGALLVRSSLPFAADDGMPQLPESHWTPICAHALCRQPG